MSRNNIAIVGNIGKDPEIKFSAKGSAYTNLSVALTSRTKNGEVWQDGAVTWYKIPFFGAKAEEVCDTFGRGMRVSVTGQLEQGQPWTDKAGQHHQDWVIGNAEIELAPKEERKTHLKSVPATPVADDDTPPF